jgi:hypothetical protein
MEEDMDIVAETPSLVVIRPCDTQTPSGGFFNIASKSWASFSARTFWIVIS